MAGMTLLPIIIPPYPPAAFVGNGAAIVRRRAQREMRQEEVFRRNTFDLYFSRNNIQNFGWYVKDESTGVLEGELGNIGVWRRWNHTLRIHTYAVTSDGESGQRWLRRDAGQRSREAVRTTDYLLRPRMFGGRHTNAQLKDLVNTKVRDIRSMQLPSMQALQNLESDELATKLNLYLLWNSNQFTPSLVRVIEEFEDLTHLRAGQPIPAQPLTLDWVIRKLTTDHARPGPLTDIQCQYWIDASPSLINPPTAAKIFEFVDNLRVLKLQVGGMYHVSGVLRGHHAHEARGERYEVLHREDFWGAMVDATPAMWTLPTILGELFSRGGGMQALEEFELTANSSLPYWETFWFPPGFLSPIPSATNLLTYLKICNFTFGNLQLLHDFILRTSANLVTCHLINLRASFVGEMNAFGAHPWAALLEMFEHNPAIPPGLLPFPNLAELNVENIQEQRFHPGPGGVLDGYWTPWDAVGLQEDPFDPLGALEPFAPICEPIHSSLRAGIRPLTDNGGIIPAVPAVAYVRQVPFYNIGPVCIIETMPVEGVAAEPARPRYWFH